jgi:hypothetical protein
MRAQQWALALSCLLVFSVSPNLNAQEETMVQQQVSDGVIAAGVENLVPQGIAKTFSPGVGTLYAFSRIQGSEGETLVIHKWFHGDQLRAEIKLPVRSKSWRTYSSKIILPEWTGDWKVEVTAEDGTVLASIPFSIQ